jgi:hypothetical protein
MPLVGDEIRKFLVRWNDRRKKRLAEAAESSLPEAA